MAFLSCGFPIGLYAQTKVQFFSLFPDNPKVRQSCVAEGQELSRQLSRFPRPDSWTFLVICDESSWGSAMTIEHRGNAANVYGSTDFTTRTTILRGSALLGTDANVTAEHLVAHELGHIFLFTADEKKAEALAMTWLNQQIASNGGGR